MKSRYQFLAVIVLLVGVIVAGCATGYVKPEKTFNNLSTFMSGAALVEREGSCYVVTTYKNQRSIQSKVDDSICHDASTGAQVEVATRLAEQQRQQAQQPPAPPAAAK